MESFTIQCTSCESRIRVRNPNMIGQIANCPKCGSMILIAAPQKITVESGNSTDSVAVTREALPPPDESLLKTPSVFETGFRIDGLPPNHPQNVDLAHSLPVDAIDDEYRLAADPDLTTGQADEKSSDALPLGAWLPEPEVTDPLPPPRTSDIDSSIQAVRAKRQESAAKSRHVMLVATIGLCSVLIAIGILVVFLRWIAKPEVVAQNKPVVPAINPADAAKPSISDNSIPLNEPGASANPEVPMAEGSESAPTNPEKPSGLEPTTTPPSTPSDLPSVEAAPAQPQPTNGPSTIGNASATKSPLGGSIAPSLDSVLGPPTQGEGQPAGDAPLELPPGLQGFSRMFNQGFEPALADTAVPPEQAAKLPDDPKNDPANQPGANANADLVPATIDKKLSAQLSGLLINKRPLSEALTTLSLVGDVPIVPDLDALMVVGASKSTLVDVKATSTVSFDAVLKSIASSTKISFVPWENRVLYARASDADLESLLPPVLPIADLVSDEAQRTQLLEGLRGLLPELGEALQLSEGGLQLALTNDNRLTWYQLARLLESWRVARGLTNETTSAIVPKGSLLPEWPAVAMQPAVKTQLKQVVPAEPIARTWQRLTAEARVACWIDWYGLQMAEIDPRQKATVIASGRTLGDVLQYYANKFQIVFAIEDARSIWVTSPEMHRVQPRLFVVPLGEKTLEEWTAELEPLAPVHPTTGASMLKLIPTPDGQYLFVQCCRPILVEPN